MKQIYIGLLVSVFLLGITAIAVTNPVYFDLSNKSSVDLNNTAGILKVSGFTTSLVGTLNSTIVGLNGREPQTMLFFGAGLVGLAGMIRRKKNRVD